VEVDGGKFVDDVGVGVGLFVVLGGVGEGVTELLIVVEGGVDGIPMDNVLIVVEGGVDGIPMDNVLIVVELSGDSPSKSVVA
jgi:hypothetical protein